LDGVLNPLILTKYNGMSHIKILFSTSGSDGEKYAFAYLPYSVQMKWEHHVAMSKGKSVL